MPTPDGPPRSVEIGPWDLNRVVEYARREAARGEPVEAWLWRRVMALEADNVELRTKLHAHGVEGY
jgi:hypothetical protein